MLDPLMPLSEVDFERLAYYQKLMRENHQVEWDTDNAFLEGIMTRLEAGFIMPYMEFNEALKTVHYQHDQTPFELDLGWLVDFKKPRFNGRTALLEEKERGPKYTLCKLDIEGNKPAEESEIYSDKGCSKKVGYVTSAIWSPIVKANIALAMIKTEYVNKDLWAEIYYSKELRPYRKVAKCKVKKKPFWAPGRAKATPPGPY